jgi:hypothetical protein
MHPGMVSGLALDSPSDVDGYSNPIETALRGHPSPETYTHAQRQRSERCESTHPGHLSKSLCDLFGGLTHDFGERGGELGAHPLS